MITEFERIPPVFVELYDAQFQLWARELKSRGLRCAIVFNPAPGAQPVYDGEGRVVAAGCWLQADIDRSVAASPRVVIRPASEHDEEMILRHCKTMLRHVLQ